MANTEIFSDAAGSRINTPANELKVKTRLNSEDKVQNKRGHSRNYSEYITPNRVYAGHINTASENPSPLRLNKSDIGGVQDVSVSGRPDSV